MRTSAAQQPKGQSHSEVLATAWQQVVAAARTLGFALASSRIDLPPSEWRQVITEECPFDLAVACRMVKIGQAQQIPGLDLPPCCFDELIHLEEPVFRYGLDNGRISAGCSPEELTALKKEFKAAATVKSGGRRQRRTEEDDDE
jgi:hypothetical protein